MEGENLTLWSGVFRRQTGEKLTLVSWSLVGSLEGDGDWLCHDTTH